MKIPQMKSKQFPNKPTHRLYISKRQMPKLLQRLNRLVHNIIRNRQNQRELKPKHVRKYVFVQFLEKMEKKKYPQEFKDADQDCGQNQGEMVLQNSNALGKQIPSFEGDNSYQSFKKGRKVKNPKAERVLADILLNSLNKEYTFGQIRNLYVHAIQKTYGVQQKQISSAKISSILKRFNLDQVISVKKRPKQVANAIKTYPSNLNKSKCKVKQEYIDRAPRSEQIDKMCLSQAIKLFQLFDDNHLDNQTAGNNMQIEQIVQIDTPSEYRINTSSQHIDTLPQYRQFQQQSERDIDRLDRLDNLPEKRYSYEMQLPQRDIDTSFMRQFH